MKTPDKLIKLLENQADMSVKEISQRLGVSRQLLHRVVKKLLEEGLLIKLGKAPKVYYRLAQKKVSESLPDDWSAEESHFLERKFIEVSPVGELLTGLDAFQYWCEKRKQPLRKTFAEYVKTNEKYEAYRNQIGLISGLKKLQNTAGFSSIELDEVYYIDFYAIERFGKTVLGKLIHFAKQTQSRQLSDRIIAQMLKPLKEVLKKHKINAVGFIPPTIQRQFQFMNYLEATLPIKEPLIKVEKVSGEIRVPQKALNKIEDRIANADASLLPVLSKSYSRVLLIDDAVGSGATLNETARKLKRSGKVKTVVGLAITGSYKGFEVISEA